MIDIDIALLLMGMTFILGWWFEDIWAQAVSIVNDANRWRHVGIEQELEDRAAEEEALRQIEWHAAQQKLMQDW